ncbi:hypothetical protein PENTCL1PPCAC_9822, partial [Pristionchus entomophagus]
SGSGTLKVMYPFYLQDSRQMCAVSLFIFSLLHDRFAGQTDHKDEYMLTNGKCGFIDLLIFQSFSVLFSVEERDCPGRWESTSRLAGSGREKRLVHGCFVMRVKLKRIDLGKKASHEKFPTAPRGRLHPASGTRTGEIPGAVRAADLIW